jgi:WD40-like Beta Propeller Repeat
MFFKQLICTMNFVTFGLQFYLNAQNQPLIASNVQNKPYISKRTPIRPASVTDSSGLTQAKSSNSTVSYPPKVVKSAPAVASSVVKTTPVTTSNVVKSATVVVKSAPATTPNVVKTAPATTPNVVKTAPTTTPNVVKMAPATSPNVVKTVPNVVKTAPTTTPNVVKTAPAASPNVVKSASATTPNVVKPTASVKNTSVQPAKTVRSTPILTNVEVRNATILNGENDDFSPVPCENGILFCTNSLVRAKNGQIKKASAPSVNDPKQKTQRKDLNLKFVPFDSATGKLQKVRTFNAKLNSRTNEGPSCFSKDGNTMYLTRNSSKHGKEIANAKGEFTVKIYVKQKQGEDWTGEVLLPFEDEDYTFCHPTLSADGQKLYFTSNMPGGFGGMDLYVSRRLSSGEWSAPSNLGAKVNTDKNELFPFLSAEGTLFFASDGQEGAKKLDLFRIDLENRTAKAISLGAPFNTEADDFGLMLLPNGKRGYFSSNRTGGFGGDDIYEFDIF